MKLPSRKYNTKDVDMLVTLLSIVQAAIKYQTELQAESVAWQSDYFDKLKERIEFAFKNYLGIDAAKDLVQATQSLNALHQQILENLSRLKLRITEEMRKQPELRDHILRVLGFTAYLKKAQTGDQEGLIDLLHQFRLNLTVLVRNQITTSTTINAAFLNSIANNAEVFTSANAGQENLKGDRKVITADAVDGLNEIYNEVISFAKLAANVFKKKPAIQAQFSFRKVSGALNAKNKGTNDQDTTVNS